MLRIGAKDSGVIRSIRNWNTNQSGCGLGAHKHSRNDTTNNRVVDSVAPPTHFGSVVSAIQHTGHTWIGGADSHDGPRQSFTLEAPSSYAQNTRKHAPSLIRSERYMPATKKAQKAPKKYLLLHNQYRLLQYWGSILCERVAVVAIVVVAVD